MKRIIRIFFAAIGVYGILLVSLYFSQESLIFMATELPENHKYDFNVPFQELNIRTEDGAQLNALHFQKEQPKGIIVYFHGNAGDLSRWGKIVAPFLEFNYDVLIVDYRGYGKSSGKRSSKRLYQDAQLVYNEALKHQAESSIIVYGRSLGCTFATYLAAKNSPKQLILETPFYSLKSLVKEKYPYFPSTYLLNFHLPSHQFISDVSCPITIFHGTDDEVVPYENGLKLYKKASNAQLISIEGGSHNNLAEFDNYWKQIDLILNSKN